MAANMAQHMADDIKKTRTAKIIDFGKRVLARRAKADHAAPVAEVRAASNAN